MLKLFIAFIFLISINPAVSVFADDLYPSEAHSDTNVNLSILPRAEHFQFEFTSPDGYGDFPPESMITYNILYGASTSAAFTTQKTTIIADYSNVDVDSNVPVAVYVIGSATKGYDGAEPVIDPVNRTITWTIYDLPPGVTDQIVSFKLKTTAYYTLPSAVSFTVKANMSNDYLKFPEQTLTKSYKWAAPAAGPTTVPQPPPPAPTAVPVPVSPFYLTDISLREIRQDQAKLFIATSKQSTLTVRYGTDSRSLINTMKSLSLQNQHIVLLDNLLPDTQYFFTVTASSSYQYAYSEIYTFHTAQPYNFRSGTRLPKVNPQTITFVSSDVFLYTPAMVNDKQLNPEIVIPQQIPFDFRFQADNNEEVKKIEAVIRDRNVLGIFSDDPVEANTTQTVLIRTDNGIFQGRLKGPQDTGLYDLFARIYDKNGNIVEQKLADLHISHPLAVYDNKTHKPVEAAQISLTYLNTYTHQFDAISPQFVPAQNPGYTNRQGLVSFVLPQGTYKATVTAIGYEQKQTVFELGQKPEQEFPVITLNPKPFDLFVIISYYSAITFDVLKNIIHFFRQTADSNRFFELNSRIVVLIFVLLTFVAFLMRIRIPLHSLPAYFKHLRKLSKGREAARTLQGRVYDRVKEQLIADADIFVMDADSHRVLRHIKTDKNGRFCCAVVKKHISLEILAEGYHPLIKTHEDSTPFQTIQGSTTGENNYYTCVLERKGARPGLIAGFLLFCRKAFSVLFEMLLVLSFISEIFLAISFGLEKVALLLLISILNLYFWLLHLTHMRNEKDLGIEN